MKTKVGLWIDRKKAFLVFLNGEEVETRLITSDVEKQLRRLDETNSTTSYESLLVPADDAQQRHMTMKLNEYFNDILTNIHDAEAVLIFGPGETKIELGKRIGKSRINGTILSIETVDRMTDPQIIAKVRQHYLAG